MLTLKTTLECSLEPLPKKEIAPISLSRLYSDSSPGIPQPESLVHGLSEFPSKHSELVLPRIMFGYQT